jgi:hypothetical protein
MITTGTTLIIVSGSKALNLSKGAHLHVLEVIPLGAKYGYFVKVQFETKGRTMSLYARHMNRLNDDEFNMNNGDPLNKIRVKVKYK